MEASERGYTVVSLEDWLFTRGAAPGPVLIVRHDVDQNPRSVLPMLRIEQELGVRSTWYFRWRTASAPVMEEVRHAGGHVGLHYETLTRLVRGRGLSAGDVDGPLIAEARSLLRREIAAFARAFGPLRTVCPHGDSRVPGVSNQVLLEDQRVTEYGVELDGNDAINRFPLSLWLTDRSAPDGFWKERIDPHRVLALQTSPVLLVVHPNNWCSGVNLWWDRMAAAALPAPRPGAGSGRLMLARTGSDDPPPLPVLEQASTRAGEVRRIDFGPVSASLHREILRFSYDSGRSLNDSAGLNTLATNAALAESRAGLLEHALGEAGVEDLAGLDVLDLGCGFGALALVFGARGASVLGVDPSPARLGVGRTVTERHGLSVRFQAASMETMQVGEASFDVAVMNNSLCYLVRRRDRRQALRVTLEALRPGGAVVISNPNRLHPRDQFTRIPLLGLLPPKLAAAGARALGRKRPEVRLLSRRAARRELRRAGFVAVRSVRGPAKSPLRARLSGYQYLVGRRPDA